ncbi:MAG TPA: alkaline phosphatase family protein [Planctomycetaceae bacterium]|nr:alkaline phosphatase family protein [Planctomycetaceae bacterium]
MRIVTANVLVTVFLVAASGHGFAADGPTDAAPTVLQGPKALPQYKHVVLVVEENKDYDQIVGNPSADYINKVLLAEGASFTKMYSEEHCSQGNYFWLFCGSNLDVGFTDVIPTKANNPAYPFQASNLGAQLFAHHRDFKGYSETLPAIGSCIEFVDDGCEHIYGRKHVPWVSFGNLPKGTTVNKSCNLRWKDFPSDFNELPDVAFVIPNLRSDMHNGSLQGSIRCGDTWLRDNLDSYYQWAKKNESLLIVTFDESDVKEMGCGGLTDPAAKPDTQLGKDQQNRVLTIFAGAHIKHAEYAEGNGITHVNILRTLEAIYGLPKSGAQQVNAARAGISDDYVITDVFGRTP